MQKPALLKVHLAVHATTRSVGSMVLDSAGQLLGKSFAEIAQHNPEADWSEVDPEEVWHATLNTIQECIAKSNLYAEQLIAVSITTERGTAMLWDRLTGQALTPLIASHCRRTKKILGDWMRMKWDRVLLQRTGLPLGPMPSAAKLIWLFAKDQKLRHRARKKEVLFGGLDSWLLWKMTLGKVHATDFTNAGATMLFNIKTCQWDKGLLNRFKIPAAILPQARPSSTVFGATEQQGALPANVPIGAIASDQAAALFALAGLEKGLVKASYDRDCHLMMNIGGRAKISKAGLATTPACSATRRASYILEGKVTDGGWPVHWLKDALQLVGGIQETSGVAEKAEPFDRKAARMVLVPQHVNSGVGDFAGGLLGLRRDANKPQIVRAALESVAFQTLQMLKVLTKEAKTSLRSVFVDGPMSQNDFLLQFQAGICNVNIARTKLGETACLGVSYLAGFAVKQFRSLNAIQRFRPLDQQFRSHFSPRERKDVLRDWDKAVANLKKL